MKLKKVESGVLEYNNYFIETPIEDFLGVFRSSRQNGVFKLFDGNVERPFEYDNFVVLLDKNETLLGKNENVGMYFRIDDKIYGLEEMFIEDEPSSNKWKFTLYDGFLQGYTRSEGEWINKGGANLTEPIQYQGFKVKAEEPLEITNYRVYSSPYIYLYGLSEGYSAEGFDKEGNSVLERRYANELGTVELFVSDILEQGNIVIYNDNGTVVAFTDLDKIVFGDKFLLVDHDLELRYRGQVLDYHPTKLTQRREMVYLVNTSDRLTYDRILIKVNNPNEDEITISFNKDEGWTDQLYLSELKPNHTKDIYIKIVRKTGQKGDFLARRFALEIDEY